MTSVRVQQEIQLPALSCRGDRRVADILDQSVDFLKLRVNVCSLKYSRQESGSPVFDTLRGQSVGTERHEPGKILVLTAQAVGHP